VNGHQLETIQALQLKKHDSQISSTEVADEFTHVQMEDVRFATISNSIQMKSIQEISKSTIHESSELSEKLECISEQSPKKGVDRVVIEQYAIRGRLSRD
jgi:hypothetical protein